MKNNKKNIFVGILVIFLYLIYGDLFKMIISTLGIRINKMPTYLSTIINIIYELSLLIIIILIYKNDIITKFKDYKKNWKDYIDKYFKYFVISLILMIISNLVITFITNIKTSTNQEYIVETLKKFPIYTFFITVFIAPILEELVFRLSFRKIFKTDILFIFFSGLVFGALHLASATTVQELLYIIPYSIPGFIFAYTLKKSDNIFVPISLHFIHNSLLMAVQIILMII